MFFITNQMFLVAKKMVKNEETSNNAIATDRLHARMGASVLWSVVGQGMVCWGWSVWAGRGGKGLGQPAEPNHAKPVAIVMKSLSEGR